MNLSISPTQTITEVDDGYVHVKLPNGALYYRDSDHRYALAKPDGTRGKRLTSASTLAKPADFDSGKLMSWAAKTNGKGIAQLVTEILAANNGTLEPEFFEWLTSHESIWDTLVENKLTFNHLRDAAGATGTKVHLALEDLCDGKLPDVEAYPEEEQGFVRALLGWWMTREPEVLNSEQFVVHSGLEFAGRFDLRVRIDGKVVLADLKTSGYLSPGYAVQLALYELGAIASGVGFSNKRMILQVRPDGEYREVESTATEDEALAAIQTYRAAGRLNRELRAAA